MRETHLAKTGRCAVVTGGASGLGQAYARRLAEDGAKIVIVDINDAAETAAAIRQAGGEVATYRCDLTDVAAVGAVTAQILHDHGRCDILVNNAGVGAARPFAELDYARFRRILAINLEAPFLLCSAFAPAMRANGWGRVINIASSLFNQGSVLGMVDYVSAKGGVVGLTRSLASELGVDGVTVNALSPGLVRTPLTEQGHGEFPPMAPEVFEFVSRMQAVPRNLTPPDLVGAVSFLASDDAAMITGQILTVDGGQTRP